MYQFQVLDVEKIRRLNFNILMGIALHKLLQMNCYQLAKGSIMFFF